MKKLTKFYLFTSVILSVSLLFCSCNKKDINVEPLEDLNFTQTSVTGYTQKSDKYSEFYNNGSAFCVIPGLYEKIVPQGMDYYKSKDWLFISGYSTAENGSTMLFVVDCTTKKLIKEITLLNEDGSLYTSHGGGVAVTEKNVFIADNMKLSQICISKIIDASASTSLKFDSVISTPVNASFCNYSNGKIFVGEFEYAKDDYNSDSTHKIAVGDETNTALTIEISLIDSDSELPKDENNCVIPSNVISHTNRIQGFVHDDYYYLSQSYGRRNNAAILVYSSGESYNQTFNFDYDNSTQILADVCLKKKIICPPMTEGICLRQGKLLILFESAAAKYSADAPIYNKAYNPIDCVWELDVKALIS